MPVIIRSATNGDMELLEAIIIKTISKLTYYNEVAKKTEIEKYNKQELCKKINNDSYSILIAENNNKIVGFCLSKLDDMVIWLEWFGVVESHRKKGIAQKIVNDLEKSATKRGCHKVWCDCRTTNLESMNFLCKAGYLPICTLKNHWYNQDFILWQKEIIPYEN